MNGMQWVWVWLIAVAAFTVGMLWAGYRRDGNCRACQKELDDLRDSMALGRRRWPRQGDDEKFEAMLQGEIGDSELANRLPLVAASHVFRAIDLDDDAESRKACP